MPCKHFNQPGINKLYVLVLMPVDPKFWEASHTLHKIHQSDWTRLNSNSVFLDHLGYQMWRSCWSTSAWSYTLSFSDTTFQTSAGCLTLSVSGRWIWWTCTALMGLWIRSLLLYYVEAVNEREQEDSNILNYHMSLIIGTLNKSHVLIVTLCYTR